MIYPGIFLLCSCCTDALKLSFLCRASEKQRTTQSVGDVGLYISVPLQITGIEFVDPTLSLLPTPCWGASVFCNTSRLGWLPGPPMIHFHELGVSCCFIHSFNKTNEEPIIQAANRCILVYIYIIGIRWMQVGDTLGLDSNRGFTYTQCFIWYNSFVLLLCVCLYHHFFVLKHF